VAGGPLDDRGPVVAPLTAVRSTTAAEDGGQANHGGRNAGSNARRFRRCKRCGGSGRKPRLGTRLLDQRR
jgi:hypothetical protein